MCDNLGRTYLSTNYISYLHTKSLLSFAAKTYCTIWDCGNDKASGPDGFNFLFLKRYWDILKGDVEFFVSEFFSSSKMPPGTNLAFITLIPKVCNPSSVKDYCPISLIGLHYKIIAKILANRLASVIGNLVSQEQSAFISGRQILDGPLMLSETIDWFKQRKKKLMIFKVDFEKAYNSVNWKYLYNILEQCGFGQKWRGWISECLKSARTSILINGSPTSEFSLKRGLRQGDPLSPFLFILIMEGLHIALKDALHNNLIRGVQVGNPSIRVSHLFYADDVVLVTEWNRVQMDNILRVLNVFYLASGLRININKSNVYGIGVSNEEVEDMAWLTGCMSGSLPFTYLGLPIGSNMSRLNHWQGFIDKFKSRLSEWKVKLLSIGGRSTLVKAVLGSVGCRFLKCQRVFYQILKGGLDIGSIKAFNLALLQKWRWRLATNSNLLWAQVVKVIHGEEAGLDQNRCKSNGVWSKIVGFINQLHSSGIVPKHTLHYKLGSGTKVDRLPSQMKSFRNEDWDIQSIMCPYVRTWGNK
ncbi:putative RNA-directed DNA polymerase, eukaryota, reverse transcriptase zinc-binding domain protein [Tanacetum coccineum]